MRVAVQISQNPGPSKLSPKDAVIENADAVFWANNTGQEHRPAPDSGPEWLIQFDQNGQPVLGPGGQPVPKNIPAGQSSSQVPFFSGGKTTYHCAVHPNDPSEKGSITVLAQLIEIRNDTGQLAYDAASINAGDYVSWVNKDPSGASHQPDLAGIAGPIAANLSSVAVQFAAAGTFPYKCKLHPNDPNDSGTITVA